MYIKRFKELTDSELDMLIDIHFNHWHQFNPKMVKENTIYKFKELYIKDKMPFGIALINDDDNIVGFCTFKKENLEKYQEYTPWISDVMILEKYRHKGYGRILIKEAENILKSLGYKEAYLWTDQAPEFYKKLGFTYKQKVLKDEGGYGELFYKKLTDNMQ